MFLFLMPDPTDLFGLNFCPGHGEVVTAHKKSQRIPVQLYSGLIPLCEIEFELFFFYTRKIKNCKQTWQNLNAWGLLEGGYSRNIVLALRFYLIFQFLWNKRFIIIRKTHRDKSTSHFCDVSLPYHFWSWHVLLHLIEAWKAALGEKIIRIMTMIHSLLSIP